MLIKEFRIVLPITVEEYQVAQLWSVAQASKNETGGGEGIEVIENTPFVNHPKYGAGQFTDKVYHLASRVPKFANFLLPKGSLEFSEKAWNAYPYCKTIISNPEYMKDNFEISIETWHLPDLGETENCHKLTEAELSKLSVVRIDIANDPINSSDYNEETDPKKVKLNVPDREALQHDWMDNLRKQVDAHRKAKENGDCDIPPNPPHMCAYKLVRCNFKWWGVQNRVEKFIQNQERRIFTNFHREVFCWMKKWIGLTMEDIRRIEDETKEDLANMRDKGSIKGTKALE